MAENIWRSTVNWETSLCYFSTPHHIIMEYFFIGLEYMCYLRLLEAAQVNREHKWYGKSCIYRIPEGPQFVLITELAATFRHDGPFFTTAGQLDQRMFLCSVICITEYQYKIYCLHPHLDIRRKLFSIRGIDILKSLPQSIVSIQNITTCKAVLADHLGDTLYNFITLGAVLA